MKQVKRGVAVIMVVTLVFLWSFHGLANSGGVEFEVPPPEEGSTQSVPEVEESVGEPEVVPPESSGETDGDVPSSSLANEEPPTASEEPPPVTEEEPPSAGEEQTPEPGEEPPSTGEEEAPEPGAFPPSSNEEEPPAAESASETQEQANAVLQGLVWQDANKDGRMDAGEKGLDGVLLMLDTRRGEQTQTIAEAVTGAEQPGSFRFEGLEPGQYRVRLALNEEQAARYSISPPAALADGVTTSTFLPFDVDNAEDAGSSGWVTLGVEESADVNCALAEQTVAGPVEGLLWIDQNMDGVMDPEEPRPDNISVELQALAGGMWQTEAQQTVTGGEFTLEPPQAGTYRLFLRTEDSTLSFSEERPAFSLAGQPFAWPRENTAPFSIPLYLSQTEMVAPQAVGDTGVPSGIKVEVVDGTTPTLKLEHEPGPGSDHWAGGYMNVIWDAKLSITNWLAVLNPLDLNTKKYGITFVALIDVPNLASEWIKGIDKALQDNKDCYLSVNGNARSLEISDFAVYGDAATSQTLKLTMRRSSYIEGDGFIGWLIGVLLGFPNMASLDVQVKVTVDISEAMQNGAIDDPSPGKVLSKGKFPPGPNGETGMSVRFYGAEQTWNDATSVIWPYPFTGNSPDIYVDENAAPAVASYQLPTWNSYISPWDTGGTYNGPLDGYVEVNGVDTTLPGPLGARTVELDGYTDIFSQLPQSRFARVVNLYTKENVTAQAAVSCTPTALSPNTPTTVTYSGTYDGKPLSPVPLTVTDRLTPPEIELIDVPSGPFPVGEPLTFKVRWRGDTSRNGALSYAIDGNGAVVWGEWANNDRNAYSIGIFTIPAFDAPGTYDLVAQLTDNFNLADSDTVQLEVADMPAVKAVKTLTNENSGESGSEIDAAMGDIITSSTMFVNNRRTPLEQSGLTLGLPPNTTLVPNSAVLTIRYGNGQELIVPVADITVTIGASFNLGEYLQSKGLALADGMTVTLVMRYQVGQVAGMVIKDDKITLSGNYNNSGTATAYPTVGAVGTIHLAPEGLQLLSVTTPLAFGQHQLPAEDTLYPCLAEEFTIEILDTMLNGNTNWRLKAQLQSGFETAGGDVLDCELVFRFGGSEYVIGAGGTEVYENVAPNYGRLSLSCAGDDGMYLRVLADSSFVTDEVYQATIQWSIVEGP